MWTLVVGALGLSVVACAPPPVRALDASDAETEVTPPPADDPQEAFVAAAGRGDFGEVDRRLLGDEVAIDGADARGLTALLAAIGRGEVAMTRRLLDGGASVDRSAQGRVPLVAAADAAIEGERIATMLLDFGADPRRTDARGHHALVAHARRGHGA
ncbi:MAG: ankyrin repeat domain-containing protein, partial [Myxococcota bacterium]